MWERPKSNEHAALQNQPVRSRFEQVDLEVLCARLTLGVPTHRVPYSIIDIAIGIIALHVYMAIYMASHIQIYIATHSAAGRRHGALPGFPKTCTFQNDVLNYTQTSKFANV